MAQGKERVSRGVALPKQSDWRRMGHRRADYPAGETRWTPARPRRHPFTLICPKLAVGVPVPGNGERCACLAGSSIPTTSARICSLHSTRC